RYTLAWFNENLTNELPEPHYWEGDSDPIFWEIKLNKDEPWESREQMFKTKIIESLDVILPKAVSSMEFLNSIAAFIDDIVVELSKVFPAEEGWEYSQNAKSLEKWTGVYFYKTSWKREGLERGIISYGIECENLQFDNLIMGIPKGSDKYTIEPAKEQLLVSKITELFGGGKTSPWWPYYKVFDYPHRYIKDILKDREGFLAGIRDNFSKMKTDVTPLVDNIINTGSITMGD
ncbi:MAG: hypothetical protein HY786_04385, partial [Deltaproteobacteria bacterium]|nr:hypothetical protein [Deltaproteobacteria bacterium]